MNRTVFPFVAVLGQEKVKNALIYNIINPRIGGVLVSGEKGTAKSTLVRSSAALSRDLVIVEVPLNVTEDRLVGSIDFRQAMLFGQRQLESGILKRADGNMLYIDEVNLLSDHIVNTLLEVAASGVNHVEREGISTAHLSRFILIGSMNPEEGKLRPQLLDRFGLYVEVDGESDLHQRTEIVQRRLAFDAAPAAFVDSYANQTVALAEQISQARLLLAEVEVTANALRMAATLAAKANCAGHRGEITLVETARAIAALAGRRMINLDDLEAAGEYALSHRVQAMSPPESAPPPEPPPEELQEEMMEDDDSPPLESDSPDERPPEDAEQPPALPECAGPEPGEPSGSTDPAAEPTDEQSGAEPADESATDDLQAAGEAYLIPRWTVPPALRVIHKGSGKRNLVKSNNRQGRYVKYRLAGQEPVSDLAFDATIRAAAAFQKLRCKGQRAIAIEHDDLRIKVREKRSGSTILFVVDASASMGANKRMKEVKAAILSMLNVSYQKRDKVGLIAFRQDRAELLLGITRSVDLAQKQLELLPTGGKTPLAAGLDLAYEVIMGLRMKDPDVLPTLVLVSDGRASGKRAAANPFNQALLAAERIGNQNINTIVMDTENDFIKFRLCQKLNEKLHGTLVSMEELKAEGIVEVVSRLR
ncbi:MAG: VWA domain-containing protein [Actinomycetia bacterium]|nr:VWA domain-containing protein [Actinomycetes bacterium]